MKSGTPTAPAAGDAVLENYIGGRWAPAAGGEWTAVTNPATGAVLAKVRMAGAADVDAAVAAARAALPSWRAQSVTARNRHLFALREALVARREELADAVIAELGKTRADAQAEVARAIESVEAASAAPMMLQGRILEDVGTNIDCETIRQPVGVCAAIVPFNFPMMVPFWFLPFAIVSGNTFILKPSEQVPMTQALVFEILDGLGLPPGVVNLVNGSRDAVDAILEHPGIDAVSFVGSAAVARHVYARAGATGKRVQAFAGAKNSMVVMPDAVVPKTIDNILGSAFGAAGQRCMAGSVLVAVGDAWERIREPLLEAAAALRVGDGADPATDMGPVVSTVARERILARVGSAVAEGATAVVGGSDCGDGSGAFVAPTVLEGVTAEMAIAREEVFGPVLSVLRVETLEEAIAFTNAGSYGNGASIFTESGAAVRTFRHDVEVGMIGVNVGVAAPVSFFPFSGWKASFLGDLHANGADGFAFFTRQKTVTSRWFSAPAGAGRYFAD